MLPESESCKKSLQNFVLVIADDFSLRYDRQLVKTPEMTAFESESIVFSNAYAAAPSCSPSRASMLTGVYPHRHGLVGLSRKDEWFKLKEEFITRNLFAFFQERGYFTANLGKLHVEPWQSLGIDVWKKADMRDPAKIENGFRSVLSRNIAGKPIFLVVGLFDPHSVKNEFLNQYKGLPEKVIRPEEVRPLSFQMVDEPQQRERIAGYYNSIKRLDHQIGILMQLLRSVGLYDSSAIVLTSDQGASFTRSKTTLYEASIHVPMALHLPGGCGGGTVVDSLVSHLDIAPTFLSLAGAGDSRLPGFDLMDIAAGRVKRKYVFAEANYHFPCRYFPQRSVRDERFKLIHNLAVGSIKYRTHPPTRSIDGDASFQMAMKDKYKGTVVERIYSRQANPPEFELYDLAADPDELDDLFGSEQLSEKREELIGVLRGWQEQDEDPYRNVDFLKNDWKKYCDKDLMAEDT